MFFNVDILYRNGPLALVWLAGSSENILRNGPTKSKHKADVMKADLDRIIELIYQQLPSVGTDTGISLRKIACLYHGVVVIHHMQLEAAIKRVTQMYLELCKLRDFDEDGNEIDVAPIEHRDLVVRVKMPVSTSSRVRNASLEDAEVAPTPRKLPLPEGVDEIGEFEETSFDTMMLNLSPRNRDNKRKNVNMDEESGNHTKLPRIVTAGELFITELEENVTANGNVNADEDRFEDWNMELEEAALVPPPPQINVDEHTGETLPGNLNDLQHEDEQNIIISPENRSRTMECNKLPLRALQEKQLIAERICRKPRRLFFNEETTIDRNVWCNQVRAALGGFDPDRRYADLQSKARLALAIPKSQYLQNMKGLNFIFNAGRNLIGTQLNELHTSIIKNVNTSMSHSRLREKNTTTTSSRMDSAIPELSRGAPSFENFPDDAADNFKEQPFVNVDVRPELMETGMGENGLQNPDENEDYDQIPLLSPIIRRLRNGQIDPPTHVTTKAVNRDNLVNEITIIELLETGEKVFSEIFPTNSTTKQQAASGLMLLLRMKNDRKIDMVQSANNDMASYGVISIRLIEH